ncbi:MAG: hypothetical protein Roseis2KO_51890 [Roseivirga sp.]
MQKHHEILSFLRYWQGQSGKPQSEKVSEQLESAQLAYVRLIDALLEQLVLIDPALLHTKSKECLLPFQAGADQETAFDAFLARDGVKSENSGFYLSLRPGQSFIGMGYLANTFLSSFAIEQEKKHQQEELDYMLHFLTSYCGFELLNGSLPEDVPCKSRLTSLGLKREGLSPWFLFKYIPPEELMDSQLENWLVQQYGLLFSYNQYLNRALDFYAGIGLDELEDHVDLS